MSSVTSNHPANRLSEEKSPYLLQHARNPVDWYPWGEAAFEKAQREDKPMLISIGYATCHWCHVMERESFENEETAKYLNEHFVAVKVDREERPDVDKVYMDALHAMGQQGGWPLNIFATSDGRPVAGGTYFPPEDAHGRKGFRHLLQLIHEAWQDNREVLQQNASALTEHLQGQAHLTSQGGYSWDASPVQNCVEQYAQAYDRQHGGFALQQQNKFPPSMGLMLLLRHGKSSGDAPVLAMVEHTLKAMVAGGIYDQLGGGLSRYSTDYQWLVPHFEKMLYDNALFAQALTEAFQVTGKPFYQAYAQDVLDYVLRDMTLPDGGFCSAEDADSEGEEGRFYVWRPEEIDSVLEPPVAAAAKAWWSISSEGNFEHNTSIPHTPRSMQVVAEELGVEEDSLAESLMEAREKLLAIRSTRPRPLLDDKVLTSWNALMISAMANAGRAFDEPRYVEAAQKAGRFLLDNLKEENGRLLRRWRDGEARFVAYLVDHAQLAVACLDLYQATFDTAWFAEAQHLMGEVNRLFRNEQGPYFDTGNDGEQLLARNMEGYDGVEPSGNTAAAQAFLRLHSLGVREDFEADALRIFSGFRTHLEQAGVSFSAMLSALWFHLSQPKEVAIVGDPEHEETKAMLALVNQSYRPNVVLAFSSPEDLPATAKVVPLLAGREAIGGKPTAYVCANMVCQLPVHSAQDLAALLD